MKSNNQALGDILNSRCHYMVPVFQRYYRWEEPQWSKLWQSLVDAQTLAKATHFMGFLVMVPETPEPGRLNTFYVIDGQQRLTSLSILLAALRDEARSQDDLDLASEIEDLLLHRHQRGADQLRLQPKEPDLTDFAAAARGEGAGAGRIGRALTYFRSRLREEPFEGPAGRRDLFNLLAQRLEFICATLEGDNPYNIFKSLNSTGVPLGPSDLIRNFVFMHVPPRDQDEFDARSWQPLETRFKSSGGSTDEAALSAFFRDYLMKDGRYIGPAETFERFEEIHEGTGFEATALLQNLCRAAADYAIIRGESPDPNPEVQNALESLQSLESSTTYPLLLKLFELRRLRELTEAQLAEALRLLSGFIMRRFICGESSRGYGQLFTAATTALQDAPVSDLREYLENRGFPGTPRFVEAFSRFPLFTSRYARPVLEALEDSIPHRERGDTSQAQIEHIMPQTLTDRWKEDLGPEWERVHESWLHTPGNLTLSAYNGVVSNHPFPVKREEYERSHLMLTRDLAQRSHWGESEIQERGEWLASKAGEIWTGPAKEPEPERVSATGELQREYWEGFRQYASTVAGLPAEARGGNYWLGFKTGARGALYCVYGSVRKRHVAVSLWITGDVAARRERLIADRDSIEAALGNELSWEETFEGRRLELKLINGLDTSDRRCWPECFAWSCEQLRRFQEILGGYLEDGKTSDDDEEPARFDFRRRYWQALADYLRKENSPIKQPVPERYDWRTFPIPIKGVSIVAKISLRHARVDIHLSFNNEAARELFHKLHAEHERVEQTLGRPVSWEEDPGKQGVLRMIREGTPADEEAWPEQHRWMHETLNRIYGGLEPLMHELGKQED